jgi:hypothetical protein
MFYYGFNEESKRCHFSADGYVMAPPGIVIVTSEVNYPDITRLELVERDDGTQAINERSDTLEDIKRRFEVEREDRLRIAGEQIQILKDVVDYGDAETATPLYEAWRAYRAKVWSLDYDAFTESGWPAKPE